MSDMQGLRNTDVVGTWEIRAPDEAAHFGLAWNDAGYVLMLLDHRQSGGHATLVQPLWRRDAVPAGVDEDGYVVYDLPGEDMEFRLGWPTEWPEHDWSSCAGHGSN